MEFNKNMDIEKYINDKMKEDAQNGFRTKYEIRPASGESPFGDREIALVRCHIPRPMSAGFKTNVYEVLDGTSVIGAYTSKPSETAILEGTFYSDTPFSVKLPETVHTVGYGICRNTKLQSINLENVISIAEDAFRYTELPEANLASVHTIGDHAFKGCHSLKTVTIGSDDNTSSAPIDIGLGAFSLCNFLETVNLKTDIILGAGCFINNTSLKFIDWEHICELNNYQKRTSEGIPYIAHAFRGCPALEMVDLSYCKNINTSEQVDRNIRHAICIDCNSLHTIKFPKGTVLAPWNVSTGDCVWISVYGIVSFGENWIVDLKDKLPLSVMQTKIAFYGLNLEKIVREAKEYIKSVDALDDRNATLTEKEDCYVFEVEELPPEEPKRVQRWHKCEMIFMKNNGSESPKDIRTLVDDIHAETSLFD